MFVGSVGLDNDCDGDTDSSDSDCECLAGVEEPCYNGPPGTAGVGWCVAGERTCLVLPGGSTAWSACNGETLPAVEDCLDGLDGVVQAPAPIFADQNPLGACNFLVCTKAAGCEVCFDGADNDGDGAVDCADLDCAVGSGCDMRTVELRWTELSAFNLSGTPMVAGMFCPAGGACGGWSALCNMQLAGGDWTCSVEAPVAARFEFQVNLPDSSCLNGLRFYGDLSNDPCGGQGSPNGALLVEVEGSPAQFTLEPNPNGPPYYNAVVDPIP